MRLQALKVRNFRPFTPKSETTFDLDHSVVLLCGGNGSGKSSFFDAVELGLTGTVRRIEKHGRLSPLLVNARYPNEPVSLRLRWLDGSKSQEIETRISHNGGAPEWPAALSGRQLHLFQHTTYLLQADIQRLVTSDSLSLGEIVEKLIVDEDIDLLIRGLAGANISRNEPSYQRAKYEVERTREDLALLTQRLVEERKAIASIQENRISLDELARNLGDVGRGLGIETPKQVISSLDQVQGIAKDMDRLLQKRLRVALETHASAERALSQASSLAVEQNELQSKQREMQISDASRQASEKALEEIRQRIGNTKKELEKSQSDISSKGAIPAVLGILSACSELEDLRVCPVCDRPVPNLKEHIQRKLLKLNREQTALQKTVTDIQTRLRKMQDQEISLNTSLERARQEVAFHRQQIASTQKRLDSFVSKYAHQPEKVRNLRGVEIYERRRLQEAKKESERLSALAEALSQLQSMALAATSGVAQQQEGLRALERQEKELRDKLRAKSSAFDRLDAFIDAAHEARGKLSERVETLLNEFIQGRAKVAFEDLFRRIARHPYFEVTIPISRVKYHKAEVNWVATYRGRRVPGGAVFSQGQLNACALSFFLALATTQPRHLGFLLLDDPVQSMDEIHVEEFASVLKAIKDLLGWQLILAVHEESLFNYLKRILYPSESGQSLIAYRLSAAQDGPEIQGEDRFEFAYKDFSLTTADNAA